MYFCNFNSVDQNNYNLNDTEEENIKRFGITLRKYLKNYLHQSRKKIVHHERSKTTPQIDQRIDDRLFILHLHYTVRERYFNKIDLILITEIYLFFPFDLC